MVAVLYRTVSLVLMVIRLTLLQQGKAFFIYHDFPYFTCPTFSSPIVTYIEALDRQVKYMHKACKTRTDVLL